MIFHAVILGFGFLANEALAAASISGKVIKTDGTPVETMRVYAYKGSSMFADYTDANGDYTINITDASITGTYTVKTGYFAMSDDMGQVRYHYEYYYPQENPSVPVTDGGATPGINFSMTRRGMMQGKVTKTDGTPIYDALVYIWSKNDSNVNGWAYTNELGNYYVTPLPSYDETNSRSVSGTYYAYVSNPGYLTKYLIDLQITDNQVTTQNATLLRKSWVSGKVSDASGAPLPGINIKVYEEGISDPSYFGISASDGTYQVEMGDGGSYLAVYDSTAKGNYIVEAQSDVSNYVKSRKKISIAYDEEQIADVNFSLAMGGEVRGKILKGDGATSIARAAVTIQNNENQGDTYSQDDGTYVLHGLAAGIDYEMSVQADNYLLAKAYNVSVTAGNTTEKNFNLVAKDSSLSGRVLGKKGGSLSMARVQATLNTDPNISHSAYSDENGDYQLSGMGAGTYKVAVTKDGYQAEEISRLKIKGSKVKNFRLKKGAQVSGRVMGKGGKGIAGAYVVFNAKIKNQGYFSAKTDEQGFYRLANLAPVRYNISVWSFDFVKKRKTKKFKAGQIISDFNFKLKRGGRISGYVYDATSGDPVYSVPVSIVNSDLVDYTDASGFYEITGVKQGWHKLFVRTINYLEQFYRGAAKVSQAKKVKARAGRETKKVNFYLTPYAKAYGK